MSHNNFSGKKILFFSVQTFNLEKDIVKQLEKHGALVTYFDERPANNNFTKGTWWEHQPTNDTKRNLMLIPFDQLQRNSNLVQNPK